MSGFRAVVRFIYHNAIHMQNSCASGSAVVVHPYGYACERQLPTAWRFLSNPPAVGMAGSGTRRAPRAPPPRWRLGHGTWPRSTGKSRVVHITRAAAGSPENRRCIRTFCNANAKILEGFQSKSAPKGRLDLDISCLAVLINTGPD